MIVTLSLLKINVIESNLTNNCFRDPNIDISIFQLMPRGVRISDLAQVLDFIYYGEIRLSTDDLNSFMALAELLQVRGLTDDDNKQPQPQQHDQPRKFGGPRPLDKSVAKQKGDPNPNPAAPTPTPSIISPPPGTML